MVTYRLVVSNPPQNGVNVDEAARCLGLTPEQFRGKARYPVPEIWFAHPDSERAEDTARALEAAGCRVTVTWSVELAGIPPRSRVRGFSFAEQGFVLQLDGTEVTIPYDHPVVGVFCRPRETPPDLAQTTRARRSSSQFLSYRDRLLETGSAAGGSAAEDGDTVPFLDLYVVGNGTPRRYTVLQNAVNFAGLGRLQPRAAANMEALVGKWEDRFGRAGVDKRLVGMRLRQQGNARPQGSEHRRGFSYASPGLMALLSAVDQQLESISQPELATRLAFLTDWLAA